MGKEIKTVDMTPTWRGSIAMLVLLIENGTPDGRKIALEELYKLADYADSKIAADKKVTEIVNKRLDI